MVLHVSELTALLKYTAKTIQLLSILNNIVSNIDNNIAKSRTLFYGILILITITLNEYSYFTNCNIIMHNIM